MKPGQYLYENYCLIFGTVFAPRWDELSGTSQSDWAKLELATRIDCTCHSDPLGRCVVHPSASPADRTQEHVYWHPQGCDCGNCDGGRSPVSVVTVILPRANAPVVHYSPSEHRYFPADWEVRPSLAELPEKSVDFKGVRVFFACGLNSNNEWSAFGWIPNRVEISVSNGILSVNGKPFGGHRSISWSLSVPEK